MARSEQNVHIFIQARMTSSRLPGKVLMAAAGKPMLQHMVERIRRVPNVEKIIIATTVNATDDGVADLSKDMGVCCYRGDENNVFSRFTEAAEMFGSDIIVRLTGDCPLIDPEIVALVIDAYVHSDADYVSNTIERTYPIGMDTEVFSKKLFDTLTDDEKTPEVLEHVTPGFYRNPDKYGFACVRAPQHLFDPNLRLTLDTAEDFELIRTVFEALYPKNQMFSLIDVLAFLRDHPQVRELSEHVKHKWLPKT